MDQATGNRYAALMGLTPQWVQALQGLPFDRAQQAVDELKKQARSHYRKLVFQYHPDRNPGDASATEKLKDLAEVLKHIEALNLQRRAPQQVIHMHFVRGPFPQQGHVRTAPSYSTSTTTGTTTAYQATRVAYVRPV